VQRNRIPTRANTCQALAATNAPVILLSLVDLGNCFVSCTTVPSVLLILLSTATLGFLSFLAVRFGGFSSKTRLAFIYLHLTSFIFFIATLSISMVCGMFFLNVFLPGIPILLFAGMILTYLIGPRLYLTSLHASETKDEKLNEWASEYARVMDTRAPTIYVTKEKNPSAFSTYGTKPKICFSSRILEDLSPEEIKAILIHEIAHIRMKTQIIKVSLSFLRFLTPFSLLHSFLDIRPQEDRADEYVRKIQGTSQYLNSARDKVFRFCS
jgi:Zn-dependent protease with chaperone function